MKKYFFVFLSCFLILFVTSCGDNKNSQENEREYVDSSYSIAELRINMPLNFDDLDNYFEFSLIDRLEEENIGEVYGDGTPYGEVGPYATDIEIDFDKSKLDELKKVIAEYRFPKGSYLVVDGELVSEFGDLYGVRIVSFESSDSNLKIYDDLKEHLSDKYIYCTFISLKDFDVIYFYGEDLNILKYELNSYINANELNDILSVSDMPSFIQE